MSKASPYYWPGVQGLRLTKFLFNVSVIFRLQSQNCFQPRSEPILLAGVQGLHWKLWKPWKLLHFPVSNMHSPTFPRTFSSKFSTYNLCWHMTKYAKDSDFLKNFEEIVWQLNRKSGRMQELVLNP